MLFIDVNKNNKLMLEFKNFNPYHDFLYQSQ